MTSYGLFHQQPAAASASGSGSVAKNTTTTTARTARGPASSSSSSLLRARRGTVGDAKNNHKLAHQNLAAAAPAFEAAASGHDGNSSAATNQHKNDLLERHTSAAKDGVIDMLTVKASKLGVSLERTLLAKREAEDGADKLQVLLHLCTQYDCAPQRTNYGSAPPPILVARGFRQRTIGAHVLDLTCTQYKGRATKLN